MVRTSNAINYRHDEGPNTEHKDRDRKKIKSLKNDQEIFWIASQSVSNWNYTQTNWWSSSSQIPPLYIWSTRVDQCWSNDRITRQLNQINKKWCLVYFCFVWWSDSVFLYCSLDDGFMCVFDFIWVFCGWLFWKFVTIDRHGDQWLMMFDYEFY